MSPCTKNCSLNTSTNICEGCGRTLDEIVEWTPLSQNSTRVIKKHLSERQLTDFIFSGQMSHFTRKPISTQQYAKIVKKWMHSIGVEDVSQYSTHSLRKSKPTVIYNRTKNVDAVRRLLGQSSVTATSAYLGVTDNSALELARNINI